MEAEPGPAVDGVLGDALEVLRIVAVLASPAVPNASQEIWRRIGLPVSVLDQRLPRAVAWGGYPGGLPVEKGTPLFPASPCPHRRDVTWTDNHCHLDDERIAGGASVAIAAARAAGVDRMITIGTDATRSRMAIDIATAHEGVWATVGLHPHDAKEGVDTIVPLLDEPGVVAIGECGLDYHYDNSPRDAQRAAFAAQIALAHARALPLVIHTREAWDDTFDILAAEGVPPRTVFHCFTGGADEANRCLALGAFLSFSGIVTFPKAADVRMAAALCPLDHLLVETDAPYLTPVPHRGKPNEPAFVPLVGAAIAEVKDIAVDAVAEASSAAAAAVFGLH